FADAAGRVQIGLVGADGANGNDGAEAIVKRAGVHALIAAARCARDAEAVAIHFGSRAYVINRPAIVVDLHAEQRLAGRPKRAAVERPVVGRASRFGVTLAGAECIDGEDKEAELYQTQTTRLHDRIAPRPGPVAVDDKDCRNLAPKRFGN